MSEKVMHNVAEKCVLERKQWRKRIHLSYDLHVRKRNREASDVPGSRGPQNMKHISPYCRLLAGMGRNQHRPNAQDYRVVMLSGWGD